MSRTDDTSIEYGPHRLNITAADCQHERCTPAFDEIEAGCMGADEIHKKYPRFNGPCPDCGQKVIVYASFLHYIAGDY